ncbi:tRNA lysidine(34) synthetase TilS [Desulfonatronum sp. SC1]|uniref:tRNA lysidine(34) synthetase TilS n=1 Tax=Desulfonatronum sp. SC1 TaxID=2109626 RepID=UPI000D2FA1E3|nr:tRNA lysidine(34) synthetase TilS [Desulfonatronum sp. SC1]PTN34914.1 tRNA lysidine(34) synthetase TilS [Desulfonatronum sp. SC1]
MHSSAPPTTIQDLPPTWARFCLGIERFLLHDLALPLHHRHLLLACSAGSDSTALLLILHCLAPRLELTINVAHLDHGLRPESAQEAGHVAEFCRRLGVRITVGRSNVARYARITGTGLEEAGRTLRYRFLFGVRRQLNADMLLTAHHADDLAEDVLMRLIRGTGWPGLAGMPCWDSARLLLRPLLHVPKQDLRDFLNDTGVSWSEDVSNADPNHTRNRVRKDIVPLMIRENPRFLEAITRLHRQGELDGDLFTSLITPLALQAKQCGRYLESSLLRTLHPGLRLRLYKAMIDDLGPGQALHDSLLRLDQAWKNRRIEATLQFPGGKSAMINPAGIRFATSRTFTSQETSTSCD